MPHRRTATPVAVAASPLGQLKSDRPDHESWTDARVASLPL